MIELIFKLLDRLMDLSKTHHEVNKALFQDFVDPAFQAFETVHADYIDSLIRYSSRFEDKTIPMDLKHPIFGEIELDSLKTGHLRSKLESFRPEDAPAQLKEFLLAIGFYLRGISASGLRIEIVDKFAGSEGLTMNNLRSLALGKNLDAVAKSFKSGEQYALIFADPMREALRQLFMGFDAPRDLGTC